MRKLQLTKVVIPEIVGYIGPDSEHSMPDYRCDCGMGIAEDYQYCPYCGAELAWDKMV